MKNLIIYLLSLRRLIAIQSNMKILSYWVLILFASTACLAQERIREKAEVKKKISEFLINSERFDIIADSAMFYTFFFKVEVAFKNGKQHAIVTPGDSTAVNICPDYIELGKFDYSVFMNKENKATFILPVILDVIDSKGRRFKFKRNLDITASTLRLYPRDLNIYDYICFTPFNYLISKEVFD